VKNYILEVDLIIKFWRKSFCFRLSHLTLEPGYFLTIFAVSSIENQKIC